MNHAKISRMFLHAEKHWLPVICWLDGGGARPPTWGGYDPE